MKEFAPQHGVPRVLALTAALAMAIGSTDAAEAHNPCPKPDQLAQKGISPACGAFLMGQLNKAGYDDPAPLNVATYQKMAKSAGSVDGKLGTKTGRAILEGEALNVQYPKLKPYGKKIAIDKGRQVSFLYNSKNRIHRILLVSSGMERPYEEKVADGRIIRGNAHTPTGIFRIREKHGKNYKSNLGLGGMPYAQFFRLYDIAFHGGNVDFDGEDSHGCVRYNYDSMKRHMRRYPIGTPVVSRERIRR